MAKKKNKPYSTSDIKDTFTVNGITYGVAPYRGGRVADVNSGKDVVNSKNVYARLDGRLWVPTRMDKDGNNIYNYVNGIKQDLSADFEGPAASAYDASSPIVAPNINRQLYWDPVNKEIRDRALSNRLLSYTAGNFLGTIIPFHLIAPSNYIGAIGEAARGNDNFFLNALSGQNKGIFSLSDNLAAFADEHPYWVFAGNFAGDMFGAGMISDTAKLFSSANRLRNLYTLSNTLNKEINNYTFNRSGNLNPNLRYYVDTGGADFIGWDVSTFNLARGHLNAINNRGMWLINRSFTPFEFKDGKIVWKPGNSRAGSSRRTVHFTTTEPVTDHGYGQWGSASETGLFPLNIVIADNGLPINILPMDTYFAITKPFTLRLLGAKIFTGNRANYNMYRKLGVDVYSSPEAFEILEKLSILQKLYDDLISLGANPLTNSELKLLNMQIRDLSDLYDKIQRNWVKNQGNPTYLDYLNLESLTGLSSDVKPYTGREVATPILLEVGYTYHSTPATHANAWYNDNNSPAESIKLFSHRSKYGTKIPEGEYQLYEKLLRENPELLDLYKPEILNKILSNRSEYDPHTIRQAEIISRLKNEQVKPQISTSEITSPVVGEVASKDIFTALQNPGEWIPTTSTMIRATTLPSSMNPTIKAFNKRLVEMLTPAQRAFLKKNIQNYIQNHRVIEAMDLIHDGDYEVDGLHFHNPDVSVFPSDLLTRMSDYDKATVLHEIRHGLEKFIKHSPELELIVQGALGDIFDDLGFKGEKYTALQDIRQGIISKIGNENIDLSNLRKYIDNMTDLEIKTQIERSSYYGELFHDYLEKNNLYTPERIQAIKEALKYIPLTVPFITNNNNE